MSAYTDPGPFVDRADHIVVGGEPPMSAANMNLLKAAVLEASVDKYTGNGGQPPAPKGTTGASSIANATPTTMFTIADTQQLYEITMFIGSNSAFYAHCFAFCDSAGNLVLLDNIANGTNLIITAGGTGNRDIKATQSAGGSAVVAWTLTKVTSA